MSLFRCIIATGLDKKPTPPVKRVKEEPATSKTPDEKETTDVDEDIETHSNTELRASQEMETGHNGVTAEQKKRKDGMKLPDKKRFVIAAPPELFEVEDIIRLLVIPCMCLKIQPQKKIT